MLIFLLDPFHWNQSDVDNRGALEEMLKKPPAAGEQETALWNKMYATNVSFFEEYWHTANDVFDPD